MLFGNGGDVLTFLRRIVTLTQDADELIPPARAGLTPEATNAHSINDFSRMHRRTPETRAEASSTCGPSDHKIVRAESDRECAGCAVMV